MDVETLPQQRAAHGRAFDMPTRTPGAPGALPLHLGGFLGLGGFPQHEVQRIALAVLHRDALARVEFIERLARKPAVARKPAHGVVHIAAFRRLVGQTLVGQRTDHRKHLRHVIGGARLMRGALDAERIRILMQGGDHPVGQVADALAVVHRPANDLVIDVGDVAHISDAVARSAQPALDHVEGDHRARVAKMAQVVHRHAAHVHAHVTALDRGKRLHRTRQRAVDTQTHGTFTRLRQCSLPPAARSLLREHPLG